MKQKKIKSTVGATRKLLRVRAMPLLFLQITFFYKHICANAPLIKNKIDKYFIEANCLGYNKGQSPDMLAEYNTIKF